MCLIRTCVRRGPSWRGSYKIYELSQRNFVNHEIATPSGPVLGHCKHGWIKDLREIDTLAHRMRWAIPVPAVTSTAINHKKENQNATFESP